MPISALMYICSDVGTPGQLAKGLKLNLSRLPRESLCFVRNSIFGEGCFRIEMDKGRTADAKINRLLKVLPAHFPTKGYRFGRKPSVTISLACLAVHNQLEINLQLSTLKKIVEREVRLKIIVFSMDEAKTYRAMLLERERVTPEKRERKGS